MERIYVCECREKTRVIQLYEDIEVAGEQLSGQSEGI